MSDLSNGQTIVSHLNPIVKTEEIGTLDSFVKREPCLIHNLIDLNETLINSNEHDSDVEIIDDSFSNDSYEALPINRVNVRKTEQHEYDTDVKIIDELCFDDSADELYFRPVNKRKKIKTRKSAEPETFRSYPVIDLTSDYDIHFSQIITYDCSDENNEEAMEWEIEFKPDVTHENDKLKKLANFDSSRITLSEVDLSVAMAGIAPVNKTVNCNVNYNHLTTSKLTNNSAKKVCKQHDGKTKENWKPVVNGLTKLPSKRSNGNISLLNVSRNISTDNKNINSASVRGGKGKVVVSPSDRCFTNKCSEESARKENILTESNHGNDNKRICDYNDTTENENSFGQRLSTVSCHDLSCSVMHVMENHHDHAYRRLNQMFPSSCALQPYMCYKCHQQPKKSSLAENMCEYHFLEGDWDEAIEILEPLVSKATCPDWKIIVYLLGYMCETNDVENLNTCCEIFSSLVSCHPPCYRPNYYLKVLTQAVEMQSLSKGGISNDGIFRDVLFSLQQHVKTIKFSEDNVEVSEDISSSINIVSLCLVMELMVDVLEANLSVWLPRRGFNPRTALSKDAECPLVVKLLWWDSEQGGLERFTDTKAFKPIINLYVLSFCKGVPAKIKHISARLLALVAEVMHACDFQLHASYPHFGQHSRNLAQTIYIHIADQQSSMIQKIIRGLSPSWLEMLVCCSRLSYFTSNNVYQQRLEFVTNCKKAAERQTKQRSLPRINKKGETRLHIVCRNERLKELEAFLSDPTIDVNVPDNAGWTPLHEAATSGKVENVDKLIMYRPPGTMGGVDLKAPGLAGLTPLMEAALGGHTSVCKLLLKYGGASLLEDKDDTGKTARDLAKSVDIRALLDQYTYEGCKAKPSSVVMFKCVPSEEFWTFLSLFGCSYLDTFALKDLLCHAAAGCRASPESRDGKARLVLDTDRLDADEMVLEQVLQYLCCNAA
ncbi:uncharacterized protein LOC134545533 isoform X1 [Bacillus rossius redtenbacheri]|uniref:uncharacterized protein LOC134545533 isoform X1 n=1 Tax=Bacillus rossius redtenbacheri TaxID=93214 RepID=UPI002FDE81A1